MSFLKGHKPLLIAGPCSAESREQVLDTARALLGLPVSLFRAGAWKPRTRPGNFEGFGATAFSWLREMRTETGFPFAVEVAEAAHIEIALKNQTDVLWIGARTTVNPFQVQSIADALQGVNIPVMVKNPVNPDTDLWLGAIERLEKAGISSVAAIHRGFSGYNAANGYRNQPNWLIPVELRRRRPDLPLICDPSHIAGRRDRVAEVAQKALDMRFDGLMIETHISPDTALSDAAQQLTPAELKELWLSLMPRSEFTGDSTTNLRLEQLRHQIDSLDTEIVDMIARRMELSEQIGTIKKENNLTVYQPNRWREIVATCTNRADKHSLNAELVLGIYEKIHQESIRIQLSPFEKEPEGLKK